VREDACKHNLLTLAVPNPCLVSPITGQPRFTICKRIKQELVALLMMPVEKLEEHLVLR
jgi:hypothetical protein